VNTWIDRRRAGVLLHVSSLPGSGPVGTLGKQATAWLDAMHSGGFSVWQFLPLGPTHEHGSPYESLSSFAGNPLLIDLENCAERGWLPAEAITPGMDAEKHRQCLRQAAGNFWQQQTNDPALRANITTFTVQQAYWLDDFVLFSVLKQLHAGKAWWQWPKALRDRHPDALTAIRNRHQDMIKQVIFEQFLFEQQWQSIKTHAEQHDILLFGDLPIYVAHDSADVWSSPALFTINEQGLCDHVAGVPPDYFSATGQRWGNPLYHWERMQADGFQWWRRRLQRQFDRMHLVRIDHFRGLESYWAIPGESEDGIIGEWLPAPGHELLQALRQHFGNLPLVAEDLGIITEEVNRLRESFALPGMKILQFAFDGHADNPYLPEHHAMNSVVYTGTHDNNTTMGWFASLDKDSRKRVMEHLHCEAGDMPWALIETAIASVAQLAIIPMQDLLALDSKARFNTPGTLGGNWQWRLSAIPAENNPPWDRTKILNQRYKRI